MNALPTTDGELVARLGEALRYEPDLRLAVLFGSFAVQRARATSDVDIGVLFTSTVSLTRELELQLTLERAVGRDVDLVRLDEASTLLKWRIANDGIPLVAYEHEWPRFRARAAIEYADFRPAFEAAAAAFQRGLSGERR